MEGHNPLVHDQTVRGSALGRGYWADYPLSALNARLSTGLILTAATQPMVADLGNSNFGVKFNLNNTNAALFAATVPGEYASDLDKLQVILNASTSASDGAKLRATLGIAKANVAANALYLNSAAAVGVDPAAFVNPTEAATGPAQTPTLLTFTFSGKGLKPLDAINILITPSDNANDDLYLHGLTLRYLRHSSLRYLDDRHD